MSRHASGRLGSILCKAALAASCLMMAAADYAYAEDLKFPHEMRRCNASDLDGLFKLKAVYEKPKNGPATQSFHNAPHQYLFFRKNQSYVEVAGSVQYMDPKSMDIELQKHFRTDKRQFVLTEGGALYFYKGGKPIDNYNCAVVLKTEPPYEWNTMLLVLPSGADSLIIKVYQPLLRPPLVAPPPPPGAPPPPR